MLRIETAIKDSRFFCSSALFHDRFLKLIRSSSQFFTLQFTRDSSLCSCRFGLLIVKAKTTSFQAGEYIKKKTRVSAGFGRAGRVTGRPFGSTGSGRANSQPVFSLDPARPQARVARVPGRAGF